MAVRRVPLGIILMNLWPFDHNVASVIADVTPPPPQVHRLSIPSKMSQTEHYQTCTHLG